MSTKTTSQVAQQAEEPRMTAAEYREKLASEGQTIVYRDYLEQLKTKARQPAEKGEWPELSGIRTLYNVVESVLPRVEHTFTKEELKWLSEFQDAAVTDLITTNSLVQGLAAAATYEGAANELSDSSYFPYLFYGISNALSSIEAQLHIAAAAQHRLHGV